MSSFVDIDISGLPANARRGPLPRRVATLANAFESREPFNTPALRTDSAPMAALPAADAPAGALMAASGPAVAALPVGERMYGALPAADTPVGVLVAASGVAIAALPVGGPVSDDVASPSEVEQIEALPVAGVTIDEFPIADDPGPNQREASPPPSSPVVEIAPVDVSPEDPVKPSSERVSAAPVSPQPPREDHFSLASAANELVSERPPSRSSRTSRPVSGITGWHAGDRPSTVVEF